MNDLSLNPSPQNASLDPRMESRISLGTLFRLALASGVASAVALHLKRGAPLNGRDSSGRSPLILAATKGHVSVCRLLLDAGAECLIRDDGGQDALGVALDKGHLEIIELIRLKMEETSRCLLVTGSEPIPSNAEPAPPERQCDGIALNGQGLIRKPGIETGHSAPADPDPRNNAGPTMRDCSIDEAISCVASASAAQAKAMPPRPDLTDLEKDKVHATPPSHRLPCPANAGASDWESEDDAPLVPADDRVASSASILDRVIASHRAVTPDADWSDLVVTWSDRHHPWAKGFADGFDGVAATRALIIASLRAGWVSKHNIEQLISHSGSGDPNRLLENQLLLALGDAGVVVDDEGICPWPEDVSGASEQTLDREEGVAADVILFLDGISDTALDADQLILDASRRSNVPSAEEERRLFSHLEMALHAIITVIASHPAVEPVLTNWAVLLETGSLSAADIIVLQTNDATLQRNSLPDHDLVDSNLNIDDQLDLKEDARDRSAERLLSFKLRQAASHENRHEQQYGDSSGGGTSLGSLALTSRRVIELAESVLIAEQTALRLPAGRSIKIAKDTTLSAGLMMRQGHDGAGLNLTDPVRQIHLALARYEAARDSILHANQKLVVWQARRLGRSPLPFEDLVQEGSIGLLKAIERYDCSRGTRFGTYAVWWIRQCMHRAIQDQSRTIRVPVHILDRCSRLRKTASALQSRFGRAPNNGELAEATGEKRSSIEFLQRCDIQVVRTEEALEPPDKVLEFEQDQPAIAVELQPQPSPEDVLLQLDVKRSLAIGLRELKHREQRILSLRFGLADGNEQTLEEVGQIYGVTRERIRQIESKALKRMRRVLPSRYFDAMFP